MKKYCLLASLAGLLVFYSCTVPHMALESDFKQQARELPVEGRKVFKPNGSFTIGNYTVGNVKRGWVRSGGFSIFVYDNVEASQRHQFSLRDSEGREWPVFGASQLRVESLKDNKGLTIEIAPNLEYYASEFTSPESGQWRLITIDPRHYLERKKFAGELSNDSASYKIDPVYKFEGKTIPMSEIIGYEFSDANGVVGAVQVINNGKVWVKPELQGDTRMVLASAMASLLLYDKLEQTLENE